MLVEDQVHWVTKVKQLVEHCPSRAPFDLRYYESVVVPTTEYVDVFTKCPLGYSAAQPRYLFARLSIPNLCNRVVGIPRTVLSSFRAVHADDIVIPANCFCQMAAIPPSDG